MRADRRLALTIARYARLDYGKLRVTKSFATLQTAMAFVTFSSHKMRHTPATIRGGADCAGGEHQACRD